MSFNIIIPCYNSAKTLPRTLESLIKQRKYIDSIILIDDGSTDNTAEIAKTHIARLPGLVCYHYQDNQGPARARNHGMDYITGDYTLFLDADDTLTPHTLEKFMQAFEEDPDIDVLIAGYTSHHQSSSKVRLPHPYKNKIDLIKAFWFGGISLCGGAVAMRSSVLELAHYPDNIRHNEDIVFFSHLLANHQSLVMPFSALNVYHSDTSLRNNTASILNEQDALIPILFDERYLPPDIMVLQNQYHAQKLISLARVASKNGKRSEAQDYVKRAVKLDPKSIFSWKAIKALI